MKHQTIRQFIWFKLKTFLLRILKGNLTVIDMVVMLLLLCVAYWLVWLVQWTFTVAALLAITYLIYRIIMWFD